MKKAIKPPLGKVLLIRKGSKYYSLETPTGWTLKGLPLNLARKLAMCIRDEIGVCQIKEI